MMARDRYPPTSANIHGTRTSRSAHWELSPHDRVGPPPRGKRATRGVGVLLLVLAPVIGVAHLGGYVALPDWLGAQVASLLLSPQSEASRQSQPRLETASLAPPSAPTESTRSEPAAANLPAPPKVEEITVKPVRLDAPAAVEAKPAIPEIAAGTKSAPPAPAAPVPAGQASGPVGRTLSDEPSTPHMGALQKRAEAAGLRPDLSPAVLSRLSDADFKTAAEAIRKALAAKADDAEIIWPASGKSGQAQFKVRFVEGAGANCRRYVVEVAKQGWLSTALPMEKCGTPRREARNK